jgi:hypothetical protein
LRSRSVLLLIARTRVVEGPLIMMIILVIGTHGS